MNCESNKGSEWHDSSWYRTTIRLTIILAFGLGGCSSDDTPKQMVESPTEIASALATSLGTWQDWSGTVHVQAWVCDWSATAAHPHATCPIPDPSFVLVGGGAEIRNVQLPGDLSTGALLTASYPTLELSAWMADSTDHVFSWPHSLRAYAIGLKLDGLSASQLRGQMSVGYVTSGAGGRIPEAHPTAVLSGGLLLVGGGAQSSGPGQLLYQSLGTENPVKWIAASKDHVVSSPGTVTAFALMIARCPTGYVGTCLEAINNEMGVRVSPDGGVGSYRVVRTQSPSQFAMTSIGGSSWQDGFPSAGRLLVNLIVGPQFAEVWTKDHVVADTTATTKAATYGLRRQMGGGGAGGRGSDGGGGGGGS